MRGYLYEISKDPKDLNSIDPDMFGEFYGREFDYAAYMSDPEQTGKIRKMFLYMLQGFGFQTNYQDVKDFSKDILQVSMPSVTARETYFKNRLKELKNDVNKLSLENFASDIGIVSGIIELIEDDNDDMVYNPDTQDLMLLDYFIRTMEPNTVYYIGQILYLH